MWSEIGAHNASRENPPHFIIQLSTCFVRHLTRTSKIFLQTSAHVIAFIIYLFIFHYKPPTYFMRKQLKLSKTETCASWPLSSSRS